MQVKESMQSFKITVFFLLISCCSQALTGNRAIGFTENKGQLFDQYNRHNKDVLFTAITGNLKIQLRRYGFSYEVFKINEHALSFVPQKSSKHPTDVLVQINRVDFDFISPGKEMTVIAMQPHEGTDNYYLNGGRAINVCTYSKVIYKNVYPFTDIEFLMSANQFKYNIILHPGANIEMVKFLLKGANNINRATSGNLHIVTSLGTISENIPMSYYNDKPLEKQEATFLLNGNVLSFSASFDRTRTFVIDPVSSLLWSTYYGSGNIDYCTGTATDAQNNVYICGYTNSTAGIATSGAYQTTFAAVFDAYVAKFNEVGTRLWGSYLGGSNTDIFYAIGLLPNGTSYLCGSTSSQSGITLNAAHQSVYGGGIDDVLLAKFTTSGQLQWCTYYGGSEHDIAQAITIDNAENIILSGHTQSAFGIATAGAYSTTYDLGYDVFVAKFTPGGNLTWGTYYGNSGTDESYGIAHDASNNIIVTGATQSFAGIATPSAHQPGIAGFQDAFISKFSASGNALIWATYYGGNGSEAGSDVEVDNTGIIYVCGTTTSTNNIATQGAYQTNNGSADDSFLAAFTPFGVRIWCTYFGGEDTDYINDLLIDPGNNLLFCGSTLSTFSISTPGAYQPNNAAVYFYDAFMARFNKYGNKLFATYFGGGANETAKGIALDATGKVYLAGETTSSASITTPLVHMPSYGGSTDAFLAKFCIPFSPALLLANTTICVGPATIAAVSGYSTYLWNSAYTNNPLVINTTTALGTYSFALEVTDTFGCYGISDTVMLFVQSCNGIEDTDANLHLKMYPVPATEWLNLNAPTGSGEIYISIYSVTGLLLFYDTIKENLAINLLQFPKGMYILRARNERGCIEKKFIKN